MPPSYRDFHCLFLLFLLGVAPSLGLAQGASAHLLKDEMRPLWTRSPSRFIREWQLLDEIPLTDPAAFARDPFVDQGGEAELTPGGDRIPHRADGGALHWRAITAFADSIDLSDGNGLKRNVVGYAHTVISRAVAGKALLCIGSDESIRAWVNGTLVLDRRGPRPLTPDEDRVEVDLKAGPNSLLVKLEQRTGPWTFVARVLEPGTIPSRIQEIGPSFREESATSLVVKTDLNPEHVAEAQVTVQVVAAGGLIRAEATAARGDSVHFDPSAWPDGAYEIRCVTRQFNGRLSTFHLAWYKGDAIVAARALTAAAAKVDASTPNGATIKMLGDLVLDRLAPDGLAVTGNPWWPIHSALMEYEELKLEAAGQPLARERANGFYRLAWNDEIDGSPQFARAYLPPGYNRTKKWPVVVRLHGYNPANPDYVRWWSVADRHGPADHEYGDQQGIIYIEPMGRGNCFYLNLGDRDILRVIGLAKEHFSVDEDRVYLTGESMGGWGTWNIGTRHPDLFAAIAPIYGGMDYHSTLTDEQRAATTQSVQFQLEKHSSWSMADGLLNMPIFVHHGDADQLVNVDYTRYGVRLLQRWGYDVRYMEMPGYGHEELGEYPHIFNWLLSHRRENSPRHVRLRSAELQHATAYWVTADQYDRPDRFMVVDAEVVGANAIRVDSENILALTLTPSEKLIDTAKSITVIWNGKPQSVASREGKIVLEADGYHPSSTAKNARVCGPMSEVIDTPFAIVIGTSSADPAMNEACQQKARALVENWHRWQRQTPRSFKDTELTDTDLDRYSLVLIGGADANLVTRKFDKKLPLKIAADAITIGGRLFPATDARVQLIYPHPLNPERYLFIVAATSATGLSFWSPSVLEVKFSDLLTNGDYDFTIEDGHVAADDQIGSSSQIWIAGGWLNREWKMDERLTVLGNTKARAHSVVLTGPLDPALLNTYIGRYEIAPGMIAVVKRDGRQLFSQVGNESRVELIPAGPDRFYVNEFQALITTDRDAFGKVIAFRSKSDGQEIVGKRID